MDNLKRGCYTKGIKFQLIEVEKMVGTLQEAEKNPSLSEKFDDLIIGKNSDEIIDLFEKNFAFQFGAPGTYLVDLYKEGK